MLNNRVMLLSVCLPKNDVDDYVWVTYAFGVDGTIATQSLEKGCVSHGVLLTCPLASSRRAVKICASAFAHCDQTLHAGIPVVNTLFAHRRSSSMSGSDRKNGMRRSFTKLR